MKNQEVSRFTERMPAMFDDFFKPWSDLFDGRIKREMNVPAVNVVEHKDHYLLSMSAPGLKKEDFKIDIDGDIMTISSEKEENLEEKEEKYTRKEYNYSAFSRSFALPEGTEQGKIQANYEDGVLKITLPRNNMLKHNSAKHIQIN